jgi:phosphate transport system substrate-binding protein
VSGLDTLLRMQGRRLLQAVPTILLAALTLVGVQCASAELSYGGSSTIGEGVIHDAARVFTARTGVPFSRIGISGSADAIPLVTRGKVVIGGLSRSLTPAERQAAIFHQIIGYDALTVTVHADNPVGGLPRERLKGIYTGRIRNWREVGGRDAPIALITEQVSKARGQIVEVQRRIMDGAPYRADRREVETGADEVRALLSERDGVTVLARPYLTKGLKPVAIEGYLPDIIHVRSGAYPLSRPLVIVIARDHSAEARRFLDFLLGAEGQAIVARYFVPAR